MKQSLQLRLGQQLAMTPQLQQAIRLLQLSSLELQSEVQEALDSNMMLEAADGELGGEHVSEDAVGDDYGSAEVEAADSDELAVEPVDIPTELATDSVWEDIYDSVAPAGGSMDGGGDMEPQRSGEESLADQLRWQLELARLSDIDRLIATIIVDALDDDGYLRASIDDVREATAGHGVEAEDDEVEAVLHLVQSLDPAGVAARDLRECLLIQLRLLPSTTPWHAEATSVVDQYLELLGNRDYTQLMRLTGFDKDQLQGGITLIQSLSPRPGAASQADSTQYVIPDVFVRKLRGDWQVELNPDAFPRVRVNPYYASLVRRADNSTDNTTMRGQLQEARWFIKSLKSRGETLLKVARCIVSRQQDFLEHGEEAMLPMVLHDVAEVVGMHESTISRVTTQKYMHTPRGIYELKYFFSSHVSTASGGEASSTAIRALLKKLVATEDTTRPLSDSKLADILAEQGINVARRTVAKYREAMAIPSSSERRSLT